MGPRIPRLPAVVSAALALAAVIPATAAAASYSIVGALDGAVHACTAVLAGFQCPTLRDAVVAADAAGGANTIQLSYGTYTLSVLPTGTDDAATGDLNVTGDLTIIGAGASGTVIDAAGLDRVFSVADGASLALQAVGMRNGRTGGASKPDQAGGAIEALGSGRLTLDSVRIFDSTATAAPGGAVSTGTGAVSIAHTWIDGNQAGGDGGGVIAAAPSALAIDASTISNNTASGKGGGLDFRAGSATPISNSTIFNNTAGGAGGGIYAALNAGQFTVVHATIVQNTAATSAGNIYAGGAGSLSLENSIIGAGEVGMVANNCAIAASGVDAGNNLFFDSPYSATSTDNCLSAPLAPTDITASDGRLAQGPGLDQTTIGGPLRLASNGGPTPTLAIVAGSPALNTANPAGCSGVFPDAGGVDQRGFTRFPGMIATCDIGAEEPEALLTLTGSVSPTSGSVGQPLTYTFTVTNTGPSIATGSRLAGTLPGGSLGAIGVSQGSCSILGGLGCNLGSVFFPGNAILTAVFTPGAPGTYSMTGTASDAESGATQPVTVSANVTGPPLATSPGGSAQQPAQSPKPSSSKKAPASNCGSLRTIRIHVQNVAKLGIVSAKIYYGGKVRATVGKPHFAATINLTKHRTGTVAVRIVARLKSGKTITGKRVYHPCEQKKLAGHAHFKL